MCENTTQIQICDSICDYTWISNTYSMIEFGQTFVALVLPQSPIFHIMCASNMDNVKPFKTFMFELHEKTL